MIFFIYILDLTNINVSFVTSWSPVLLQQRALWNRILSKGIIKSTHNPVFFKLSAISCRRSLSLLWMSGLISISGVFALKQWHKFNGDAKNMGARVWQTFAFLFVPARYLHNKSQQELDLEPKFIFSKKLRAAFILMSTFSSVGLIACWSLICSQHKQTS